MDPTARLLVIDDTPQNGRLLEAMLSPHGYSVTLAYSGSEGLEKVRSEHPDLVLLDILMPDMTGYDVCRRLREDPATRLLPVVMLTSSGDQDKVDAIEAGADDFIARPFNPQELLSRVRSLLRIKEYHDTIQVQAAELAEWNLSLEQRVQSQLAQLEGLDRLRRFFSAPVADIILSGGGQMLEPHRGEVTIVFCTLRGFTAFSATAEPEEVMGALSQFYNAVGHMTLRFEATLEQFAGDSVMTIFNDPIPCANHTAAAVRMAVEVRERTIALSQGWRLNGYDLDVGVGIAEGHATLGRVGFEGRFDYRATGTVVQLASRLCSHALGGQILLAQRGYACVTDLVDVEAVGPLRLEGFHDPVEAYNVTGLKGSTPSREEPPTIDQRLAANMFLREGDFWSLTYAGVVVRLKDSKGLRDIAQLLATPGREVAAVDLSSGASYRDAGRAPSTITDLGLGVEADAGEALDAEARAQYRSRLADLEGEISEAEANNDSERASRAREEREFLVAELGAAVGLGGRPRRLLDPAERARKAVTWRVREAINHIEKAHQALGSHLRRSVRTGSFCVYDPVVPTDWRFSAEDPVTGC
jgi:adenylate cyclase